jgi:hypothetical protein
LSDKGLLPGQRLTLDAKGLGRRTATVERVEAGRVLLALLTDEPLPRAIEGAAATIEFPGRAGLYRATGTIGLADRGFAHFHLTGTLERLQRREWARAEAVRPAKVEPVGDPEHAIETWTLDLSAGGVRLAGPKGLEVGTRIALRIRLDDQREVVVQATAEVARETDAGHVGVRIEEIAEADRERLVRFVFEQQRQALRLAGT